MTPPLRTMSAACRTSRGCGFSGWTVKSCAIVSLELRPDGDATRRQWRQLAQVPIAFARSVKVRSDGREQAELPRTLRPVAVLLRRMAAGHDFDSAAAEVPERPEQLRALALVEIVASRMRQ